MQAESSVQAGAEADFHPSHYLVRVEDLHQAVADFQAAGFFVEYGSKPDKAYNAMIYFEEGGFIELFNPPLHGLKGRLQRSMAWLGAKLGHALLARFNRWVTYSGLVDFALESRVDLNVSLEAARQRGAIVGKIRDSSRIREDGVTTRWQLSIPDRAEAPFLMGPYEPPPDLSATMLAHSNGVRRLEGMIIATPDPQAYLERLARLVSDPVSANGSLTLHGFEIRVEAGANHEYRALLVDKAPARAELLHGLKLIPRQGA